jgi:hypothetical protein
MRTGLVTVVVPASNDEPIEQRFQRELVERRRVDVGLQKETR